ncbi:hypothetical protein [Aquipuribacter sp. MA13-6]|uniref:hypothetical protein n=1 Tax=unclassified Aquipuribacter TaxID=2635084 RepID=UPI003EE88CB1
MTGQRTVEVVTPEGDAAPPPGRARGVAAAVLTVAAALATVLALLAVWTFRTLTDSDLFVARVGSVIEEPAVSQAVADTAADRFVSAVDLERRVADRLPPELSAFAPTLAGAVESTMAREGARALQTDELRAVWDETLRRGHQATVAVLSGQDRELLSSEAGVIALDLAPVMGAIADRDGVLAGLLGRPAVQAGTVSTVAELEERLGVELPEQSGLVVLFESEDLAAAQAGYQALRLSVRLAPVVALLLVLLAVGLSRHRLRTLLSVVVGVAVGLLLVRLAVEPVRSAVVGSVADDGLATGVAAAFDAVLSSVFTGVVVAAVLGLLALAALVLLGRSRRRRALLAPA